MHPICARSICSRTQPLLACCDPLLVAAGSQLVQLSLSAIILGAYFCAINCTEPEPIETVPSPTLLFLRLKNISSTARLVRYEFVENGHEHELQVPHR